MRTIVLDTETTGLEPSQGHRIIEIGCVELVNRRLTGRHYHQYINPQREVEEEAIAVHGITNEFLADKPVFHQIAEEFREFVDGATLVIHNAPFDVGFINHEFSMLRPKLPGIDTRCQIIDSLQMARQKHPGQKNNLDALCKRYGVDNSQRDLHGALLDSEILADVYLLMTGGQTRLSLGSGEAESDSDNEVVGGIRRLAERAKIPVIRANSEELGRHEERLNALGEGCLWRR